MLDIWMRKNDPLAKRIIWIFSLIIFLAITALAKVELKVDLGFNPHLFAKTNAFINSSVAMLLIAGLFAVKAKRLVLHRNFMLVAIILSFLFLLSYVCHHLFTGSTIYGDVNHDGQLSAAEKDGVGTSRTIYMIILLTHIPLAGIILPFILFTAYRSLTGEYEKHKRIGRITWPIWLYVAITGVVVYWMIEPYYT
jgi:putative membrane protein